MNKKLLEHGANTNAQTPSGETSLYQAAASRDFEIVHALFLRETELTLKREKIDKDG